MDTDGATRDAGRWVTLEGAFNFRDLGGYPGSGGTSVLRGAVYRSDALHLLSGGDLEAIAGIGVDRVIDLRSPDEITAVGRGGLGRAGVEYLTASVIPTLDGEALGAPPVDDMARRYMWYLEVGGDALVRAFDAVAERRDGAVVFHCSAGKDRTGVLAALLLSVLGVSSEDIVADYVLTNSVIHLILGRLAEDPLRAEAIAVMPARRRTVHADVMESFLGMLDRTHGGAEAWLTGAGVPATSIDALRERLLPPP